MSNDIQIDLTDGLAAGVFRAGLKSGVISFGPIVQWADRRITEEAAPAEWLIELSIASPDRVNDVVALLRPASEGVANEAVANAGLALVDLPSDRSVASARRLLSVMHPFVQHAEANALLRQLSEWGDALTASDAESAAEVFAFASARQNPSIRAFFQPVVWDA